MSISSQAKNTASSKPNPHHAMEVPAPQPHRWRSLWQLANSLIPYIGLWFVAYYAMSVSYWLALPAIILAAGFLVRLFIIFHDCGHQSFYRSRRANDIVGIITGILTYTPYHYWHTAHAKHHATSGNLDKRGYGDVWMMTIEEYKAAPRMERLKYRLYRHPIVMFGLGPLFIVLITHRLIRRKANRADRISVHLTNVALVALVTGMCLLIGWKAYLAIQLPILFVAIASGIWLFYVQHQYEGVYWERQQSWDFVSASLEGGSFYRLPAVLNWFTGNIGYHHVHHLNSRIPNYYLPDYHEEIARTTPVPEVTLWGSLKSLRFRLWDEESRRLIGFGEAKRKLKQAA